MRIFREATCRNLLKRPLVMGVPLPGLILLGAVVGGIETLGGGSGKLKDLVALAIALLGYIGLRISARFAKTGFEESIVFAFERMATIFDRKKITNKSINLHPCGVEIQAPDTCDERELIQGKVVLEKRLKALGSKESLRLIFEFSNNGMSASRIASEESSVPFKTTVKSITDGFVSDESFVYSLYELPSATDPLWIFNELSQLKSAFKVIVSFSGLDRFKIKRRLEGARLRNSISTSVDSEVGFEEVSKVLEGIVRGDDGVVEASLVLISDKPLPLLDSGYFCLEKNKLLTLSSILGIRNRSHRSHVVRFCTATDLMPTVFDPYDLGIAILKTRRGMPCYFDPQDPRLDALHWIVSGATGAGKSFFTGLILRRLVQSGRPMSVFFVDHGRSFRRVVQADGGPFVEPDSYAELEATLSGSLSVLNTQGTMSGIELSDLPLDQKKRAVGLVLSEIEKFLKRRSSFHPVYVVLDECWNYIMSEPLLVQRAFREYRKLNGAVVAVTQSIGDFLTEDVGQSIFQNAPIRILLRQGEDLSENKRRLGLNGVELERTQELTREKGVYSECLIKTPFLSRLGQLRPSKEEHDLLRTDNLREEFITERLKAVVNG